MTRAEKRRLYLERQLRGALMRRNAFTGPDHEIQPLVDLLIDGRRAMAQFGHVKNNGEHVVDSNRTRVAATNGAMNLGDYLPSVMGTIDHPTSSGSNVAAGRRTMLETSMLHSSRVYRAGASLVEMPTTEMLDTGHVPVIQELPSDFVTIEAGQFTKMAPDTDGDIELEGEAGGDGPADPGPAPDADAATELTTSVIPVHTARVRRNGMTQYALRYDVKRSEMRQKGIERVATDLMTAIALGLARAADRELLEALSAYELEALTIANVAAQGLHWPELRALIGTNGDGAKIAHDGSLRAVVAASDVSGPPAELTADMAGTIVGAWDRAALAVGENIDLLAERTNAAGRLTVTAWVDLQPLIPDASKFWTLSA